MHHLDENQLNINKLRILCLDRTGNDIEVNIDQNESKTGPKRQINWSVISVVR